MQEEEVSTSWLFIQEKKITDVHVTKNALHFFLYNVYYRNHSKAGVSTVS